MQRILRAGLPRIALLVRAPGRVNLIGEHTDYNGFPVLPMAIDRHIWVGSAPLASPVLRIRSVEPQRYAAEEIELERLPERRPRGTWADYVVAGARCRPPGRGTELLVAGDIPMAAGLSSSSALVVATMLALGGDGDRLRLAEEARVAERYVGTLSGGMDQAISLLAERDHALRIDFRPLRTASVAIPASIGMVVAHSGIEAHKSGAAREGYNSRVRQCLQAARLLGAAGDGLLADVAGERRAERAAALDDRQLASRARFVFEEARRVAQAVEALGAADLRQLGELLDESHAGLRDLYEVSHPAVDALVRRTRAAGAAGARVVGAGFGGCIVAVCEREQAAPLAATLGDSAWAFRPAAAARRVALQRY